MNKVDNKVLKTSLSTLLRRFSGTDIVSGLKDQYQVSTTQVSLDSIKDNGVLSKARISEQQLQGVMKTISEKGLASPLYIFKCKDGYEILYPRIVYIAAKKLKLNYVPCTLIDIPEDEMLVFLAYTMMDSKRSNIVELSFVLNRLQSKFHYKQVEIAMMMHQSRSQITNIMRLVRLPSFVLNDLSNNKLSFGHARVLVNVKEELLPEIIKRIYKEKLSVRDLEGIFKSNQEEIKLSHKIDKKYKVKSHISKKKISLEFADQEDLDKFIRQLLAK